MSLSASLQPNNTLAAVSTAKNAFSRFLVDEGMTHDEAHAAIVESSGGLGLAVIMDKFAIFLAFGEGTRGTKLATNTVNSYYGNVKLWLLSQYPEQRLLAERELQVVGARLSKYCKKRGGGQVVKKILGERVHRLERIIEENDFRLPPAASLQANPPGKVVGVRKAASKALRAVWVEWRTGLPPRWAKSSPLTKQDKHEYKFAVAYMSLFLTEGYTLIASSPAFSADVKTYGELAQARFLKFLRDCEIDAKSLGTIVKAMRELYRHGELNNLIAAHADLIREGLVVDHLPSGFQAICVLPLVVGGSGSLPK